MLDCVIPVLGPNVTNDPHATTLQKAETQPAHYKHLLIHRQILDFSSCFIGGKVYFVILVLHSSREKLNHNLCFIIYFTDFMYFCLFYQVSWQLQYLPFGTEREGVVSTAHSSLTAPAYRTTKTRFNLLKETFQAEASAYWAAPGSLLHSNCVSFIAYCL